MWSRSPTCRPGLRSREDCVTFARNVAHFRVFHAKKFTFLADFVKFRPFSAVYKIGGREQWSGCVTRYYGGA